MEKTLRLEAAVVAVCHYCAREFKISTTITSDDDVAKDIDRERHRLVFIFNTLPDFLSEHHHHHHRHFLRHAMPVYIYISFLFCLRKKP